MNECNNSEYKKDEPCFSLNTIETYCGKSKIALKKMIARGELKAIIVPRCYGKAKEFFVIPKSALSGFLTDDVISKLPVLEDSQPAYWEEQKRKKEEEHLNRIKREEEWERFQQEKEVIKCKEVNTIQAFKTKYNGKEFRSRLEARWAIFFDACGMKWDYEPEGYLLSNGQGYLPDFLLHGLVGRVEGDLYVEVKGKMTQNDAEKISLFVGAKKMCDGYSYDELERPLLIVGNIFSHGTNSGYIDRSFEMSYTHDLLPFFNYLTIDGDYYGCVLGVNKHGEAETFEDDCNYLRDCDVEKTEAAFKKALNAQFSREGKYVPDETRPRI